MSAMEATSNTVEARSSLIHHLNEDLLLDIFMFNAHMDEDPYESDRPIQDWGPRALTDARNVSHVCRLWRQAILSSTSLWGRLVDLEYLVHMKEEWRWEIIRRTGISPLHVKGKQVKNNPAFLLLLAHILDAHWERIDTLDVVAYFEKNYKGDFWYPIARPSKALKIIRINLGALEEPIHAGLGQTLFGNDAPELREVHFPMCFPTNLYFYSSWLSQLCHLIVSNSTSAPRPTLLAWLERLCGMPQLQTLSLSDVFNPVLEDPMPLPVVKLPNLTELQVSHDVYSAALFLNHIEALPECRLGINISEASSTAEFPSRSLLITEVLSKYSQRWFSANTKCTNLALETTWRTLLIEQFEQNRSGFPSMETPVFTARLDVDYNVELQARLPYVNAFSHCNFNHITMLSIRINSTPAPSLQNLIFNFVYALPEVRSLSTTMEVIAQLTQLPRGTGAPPAFPKLQTLDLSTTSVCREDKDAGRDVEYGCEVGEEFFRQRLEDNCPVQVLDLTSCNAVTNFGYLESLEGMKVIWIDREGNQQEAICGSGRVAEGLGLLI
ncbi:hypothetical protein NLJ89_g8266 [Agrocybe chaxingu]|uniref:F-box domain-containing protein n=1 Tax=Agrocybe chaxingu TaxID=84603 RepID=A0A9W8JVK1_9AGAR|nr:hypothetical protein NLJ89_g8266 [Agrocybe chaxingu]